MSAEAFATIFEVIKRHDHLKKKIKPTMNVAKHSNFI